MRNLLIERSIDPETGKEIVKHKRGSIVVLDPKDNAILAMVSSPSYDANLFVRGISSKKYNALLNNPDRPLVNRVTLGIYPPASTVKPFIAVAALTEGVITPNTTRNDPVGGKYRTLPVVNSVTGYVGDMVESIFIKRLKSQSIRISIKLPTILVLIASRHG